MGTITLPNVRAVSDITIPTRLKDGGIYVDWSLMKDIRVFIYSDAQKAMAGRCTVSVSTEDPSILVCEYAATKPQYLGVNRIVVQCRYHDRIKTYDKPAFRIVRTTDEVDGEMVELDDPIVDIELEVQDVSSSILDAAIAACVKVTAEAKDVVDVHRGPEGLSAYEVAVSEGFVGDELAWLASLKGEQGDQGEQGERGPAGVQAAVVDIDNSTGIPEAQISVNEGLLSLSLRHLKGEKGEQGNTGSSVEYPFELVNNRTTDDATKALSAAEGKRMGDDIADLDKDFAGLSETTRRNYAPGYATSNDATLVTATNVAATDYFPVEAGDTIVWRYGGAQASKVKLTLYTEDGAYVSYYGSSGANSRTVTLSETSTAKKARATVYYDSENEKCVDGVYVSVNGAKVWEPVEAHKATFEGTVLTKEQAIPLDGKEAARNNVDLPGVLHGQKANYTTGGYVCGTNSRYVPYDGWCLTEFIPYTGGPIVWRFGNAPFNDSYQPGLVYYDADKAQLNYNSSLGFAEEREVSPSVEGVAYIRASFAPTYRGQFNHTPLTINGVDWSVRDGYKAAVKSDEDRLWKTWPLGTIVQGDVSASSGNVDSSGTYAEYRCASRSLYCVPFEGAKFRFRSPLNTPYLYWMAIRWCTANAVPVGTQYFYGPYSEEIALPENAKCFRIMFGCRYRYGLSGTNNMKKVTPEEINAFFAAGTMAIEYLDVTADGSHARNRHLDAQVSAARRVLDVTENVNNGMDKLPVFAHISDVHGDVIRLRNCMEYVDAVGGVDALLNSGDSTCYKALNHTRYQDDLAAGMQTPYLFCIGNHESWPTGQTTMFERNMAILVEQQGYLKGLNTPADNCWYYKDFAAKKVRVIALNYYDNGVYAGRLGQDQIDWFISTLQTTPAGYGILVMVHSPEDHVVAPSGYDKFMQPSPKFGDNYQPDGFYVGSRPIMQIVDAFISRATLSTSYSDHSATYDGSSDTTRETVTIEADFTGVDPSTEFIAYVSGHRHEDYVGYYEHAQNRQLCLDVVCGTGLFGDSTNSAWTNQCDLPRGGKGAQQDAFNIYAIDRVGGNVRIVRVGANVTVRFAHRDMMIIPYK